MNIKGPSTKITALLIILVGVSTVLVLGYETFWLSSLFKEKIELTAQVEELLKQKAFLTRDLSVATNKFARTQENIQALTKELSQIKNFNIYLKKRAGEFSQVIRSKAERLKQENAKLTALSAANDFLEKQIASFQEEAKDEAKELKNKVEVTLTPQKSQE